MLFVIISGVLTVIVMISLVAITVRVGAEIQWSVGQMLLKTRSLFLWKTCPPTIV